MQRICLPLKSSIKAQQEEVPREAAMMQEPPPQEPPPHEFGPGGAAALQSSAMVRECTRRKASCQILAKGCQYGNITPIFGCIGTNFCETLIFKNFRS